MSRVIIFSRKFPAYHPRVGQETFFVEKFCESIGVFAPSEIYSGLDVRWPKYHTIRAGERWKAGDMFSPRVWSGVPYKSKQIAIAPDVEIKKTWEFSITGGIFVLNRVRYHGEVDGDHELLERIATNDGLNRFDLLAWFKYPMPFSGQIICWNEKIEY